MQHADPQADPHDAIDAQLRDLAPRLAHDPSEFNTTTAALPESASEPSLRATPSYDSTGDIRDLTPRARSGRGVALLVVGAGIAATMAWHFYGEEAKQKLSHFVPQLLVGASAPTQDVNAAGPQDSAEVTASQPATDRARAQDTAAAAPATPTPPATVLAAPTADTPPTQAALPPEVAQSMETMAREIASLKQTVEQLQAGQQQLTRDVAKAEHETRRKLTAQAARPVPPPRPQRAVTPGAPPRNLGNLTPYSPQAYPQGQTYPQGAAQRDAYIPPPAPAQLPPQPGDASAPRPPMPLR